MKKMRFKKTVLAVALAMGIIFNAHADEYYYFKEYKVDGLLTAAMAPTVDLAVSKALPKFAGMASSDKAANEFLKESTKHLLTAGGVLDGITGGDNGIIENAIDNVTNVEKIVDTTAHAISGFVPAGTAIIWFDDFIKELTAQMEETSIFYRDTLNEIAEISNALEDDALAVINTNPLDYSGNMGMIEELNKRRRVLIEHLKIHKTNLETKYDYGINIGIGTKNFNIKRIDEMIEKMQGNISSLPNEYEDFYEKTVATLIENGKKAREMVSEENKKIEEIVALYQKAYEDAGMPIPAGPRRTDTLENALRDWKIPEDVLRDARNQKAKDIALAIESLQQSRLGSNRWDGGMSALLTYCNSSNCETSVRHDSGSGTSMTGKWSKPGQVIDFYTDWISFNLAPQALSARVKVDLSTAQSRVRNGKTYYYGDLDLDQQDLFGNSNKVTNAYFDTNESLDFFRFNLDAWDYSNFNDTRMDGYYGQRLEASKLPDKGVSSYDFGDGPYQIAYSGYQDGRMLVNWASKKVYGYNGRDFFIGNVNRQTRELTGRYIRIDDYLRPADVQYYPGRNRFVSATPSLQLYGRDAPNGIGGTFDFGSIYSFGGPGGCTIDPASGKCDSPTLPIATGNVLVASHLNKKDVKTKAEPQRTTVWHGFATGIATHYYDTGVNDFDRELLTSSLANDVRLTLRPDDGEMNGTLLTRAIGNGTAYGLAANRADSVYVNKNAFAAVNTDGGRLSYLATTNQDDGYDYLSWGVWGTQLPVEADNSLTKIHDAYWIAGAPTIDMPQTGTAEYNGSVRGAGFTNDGYQISIAGSSTVIANFETHKISGNLNLLIQTSVTPSPYADAQINGAMNDNRFTGTLTGPDITQGDIRGAFYGPGQSAPGGIPQEVGGNWNIIKSDSQATGIFVGKKTE